MALMTQYRTFFVSPFGEASVCDELNAFLKSHRIVNVEKRMLDGERGTGWLFLVEYGLEQKNPQGASGSAARVDYREILSDRDFALFDKLRVLRKEFSEKQGIPVYAVFTNEHLAAMVKNKVSTLKDIAALPGVGDSKIKQYGSAFLAAIVENSPADSSAAGPAAAGQHETGEMPF